MRAFAFTILASFLVTLTGCPGATPAGGCAAKCADQVPAAACLDGTILRTYEAADECSDACVISQSDRRCDVACRDAQCVTGGGGGGGGGASDGGGGGGGGGSCDGVSCHTPPASVCLDAQTLRVFEPTGVCSGGQCSYTARSETCASGCQSGACVGNPCQGVTCSTPPANVCVNATTLKSYQSAGTCSAGVCSYPYSQMTCPFGCQSGACVNDPCAGKTCNQPPATFCLNATTLRSFGTAGVCSGGSCLYSPTDSTCQFGCANGACANDPCVGKTCNQPPAPSCLSSTTLRSFGTAGVCSGGSCLYTPTDSTCQYGCVAGACSGNPCQGVTCNSPPANACVNATTLRSFQSPGTCSGGGCTYAPVDLVCAFGCALGACNNDPCQGVSCNTPPAASCTSATNLRRYSATGSCGGGACSYTPMDLTCQFGCSGGACNNDPCQGVSCNSPPASACVNATTLRSFAAAGACSGGACSYTPTDTSCQYGCSNGACNNNPCQGVSCTNPPASTCVGGSVRTYGSPGTCSGGTCSYAFTDTVCANGCSGGACNAPSCGGVTCNTPPAGSCTSANNLRTYYPAGTCAGTTCYYVSYDISCSQGCLNGACIAGSWTLESGPYGNTFRETNVVYDGTGHPVMAGCESNGTVKVRRLSESGWTEEVVDTGMGGYCEAAVALDSAGEPMVAYYDSLNYDLRFAKRAGGSWAPKELVANTDSAGSGVSLIIDPAGNTVAAYSYSGPSATYAVKLATRGSAGTWTEQTIMTGNTARTTMRVVNGTLYVLLDAGWSSAVATRPAASWVLAPIYAGLQYSSGYDMLEKSFTIEAGIPKLMMKYDNPMRGAGNYVWRTSTSATAWTEESFSSEVPLAVRTNAPYAAFVQRGSYPSTPIIRVQTNGVWLDAVNPVPYGGSITAPVSYVGTGGRHVLLDATGRRLSSPPVCTPQCSGRTCGDNGCGGTCGACGTGSCAPNGTCSALRQLTIPGPLPSYAALGAGSTLHVGEQGGTYYPLKYRQVIGGVWPLASDVTGSDQGTLSTRDHVPVDSTDAPVLASNRSTPTNGTFLFRRSAGAWTSSQPSTTQNGMFGVSSGDLWHYLECSAYVVSYRSGPSGAWTGALTAVYNRPSSNDGMSCQGMTVSSAGKVSIMMMRSYWVSGSNPGERYEHGVLSNETGSWVFTGLTGINVMNYPSGQLRYDGSGALHYLGTGGYQVKPAGGAFAVETGPAGLPASLTNVKLVADRTGVFHLVFLKSNGTGLSTELVLAKRTAASTWAIESTPLMQGLAAGYATSSNFVGAAFDAANKPWFIVDDNLTYRAITR